MNLGKKSSNWIKIMESVDLKNPKELKKFGITIAVMFPLIFCGLLPLIFSFNIPQWPLCVSLFFGPLAFIAPKILYPFFLFWMKLGLVLNWINSRIILSILFYGLFTPIALFFKLIGRDPMLRSFDKECSSYRVVSENRAPK